MTRRLVVACVALVLSACTSSPGDAPTTPPATSDAGSPTTEPSSPEPTVEPTTPAPSGPRLASGEALPDGCAGAARPVDTATFVALGRAWAIAPNGTHLSCLFEVGDPGPFVWGPLGDRALLGGLEVRGLGGAPSVAPTPAQPVASSWGHPTGKSVVFIPGDPTSLEKLHVEDSTFEDVTPLDDAEYLSVAYHPSGLAFGFAVRGSSGKESLWLSTNDGESPERIVFTEVGTKFGALAFTQDGTTMLYAALHADDHTDLHKIDLTDTSRAPVLWASPPGLRILDIQPGSDLDTAAFTTGTSCNDGVAMLVSHAKPKGQPLLPDAAAPTRAVGWLDDHRVLVAVGPCDGPLDLYAVNAGTLASVPLVLEVDAASVRTPFPTPPPALPAPAPDDSGFA